MKGLSTTQARWTGVPVEGGDDSNRVPSPWTKVGGGGIFDRIRVRIGVIA